MHYPARYFVRGISLSLLSDEGLGTLQVKRLIARVVGRKQAFVPQGDTVPLQLLAENELVRHGGLYFAGDKRMAPADARSSTFRIETVGDAILSG